tara:strand:- start:733 stop:1008 length:276 start_codon:yes stop_codon:yes gene_type:complete
MKKIRKYYDGVMISEKLPDNYRLSREEKKCSNCKFYQSILSSSGVCKKWNAQVRKAWLCNAWKVDVPNQSMSSRPTNQQTPNTNMRRGGRY